MEDDSNRAGRVGSALVAISGLTAGGTHKLRSDFMNLMVQERCILTISSGLFLGEIEKANPKRCIGVNLFPFQGSPTASCVPGSYRRVIANKRKFGPNAQDRAAVKTPQAARRSYG
jgi:hypothetical protein